MNHPLPFKTMYCFLISRTKLICKHMTGLKQNLVKFISFGFSPKNVVSKIREKKKRKKKK